MLQVQSLAARRGMRKVFADVGFQLEAGGCIVVTGANGSGKSSLLRVLAGLLPATSGRILWQDKQVEDWDEQRRRLHYVGHLDALKPELKVAEMLDYWAALKGKKASHALLATVGLAAFHDKPVRVLSAGQRRRLGLTRLILDEAPLWLLDEPATALDQAGLDLLLELMMTHRLKGGMAVIATHQELGCPGATFLQMGI